jgi:fructose-bisphosphate aldolase class II
MPIATFDPWCARLDNAKRGRFAYPGADLSGLDTLDAALEGFAETRSTGTRLSAR